MKIFDVDQSSKRAATCPHLPLLKQIRLYVIILIAMNSPELISQLAKLNILVSACTISTIGLITGYIIIRGLD